LVATDTNLFIRLLRKGVYVKGKCALIEKVKRYGKNVTRKHWENKGE